MFCLVLQGTRDLDLPFLEDQPRKIDRGPRRTGTAEHAPCWGGRSKGGNPIRCHLSSDVTEKKTGIFMEEYGRLIYHDIPWYTPIFYIFKDRSDGGWDPWVSSSMLTLSNSATFLAGRSFDEAVPCLKQAAQPAGDRRGYGSYVWSSQIGCFLSGRWWCLILICF